MQMQLLPETTLQPLNRADGSASYSYHGFRVLAAVNGPVEIQRRDELPEEAAIDVVIRPASGLGSKTPLACPSFHGTNISFKVFVSAILSRSFKKPYGMWYSSLLIREN